MIIPDKSKTIIIEGEGTDLSELPLNEVPYRAADGTIKGSGLRMLSSGALLAPVGFAVESGSVDFGDVLRLSETASFLGLLNMVDQKQYQFLDYGVPRNGPSLPPFRFYLKESEKKVEATNQDGVTLTANPLNFEYTTKLTSRVNALIFKAVEKMENFRMCIRDMDSGVALKYYPSKSSWVTGLNGTTLDVGENILDFGDTALIFQSGTDISFEIVADNIYLAGDEIPWFAGILQEGSFIRIADSQDITNLQEQIDAIGGESVDWDTIQGKPSTFTPSAHQHPISDVTGLQSALDSKMDSNISISYSSLTDKPILFSGNYDDLSGKPTLFSGSYSDLINKPSYATVASSGSYNDLINKPVIPTVNYPVTSVAGKTGSVSLVASDISGLASVATSGAYSSLSGLPSIPAAQVNSDWSAVSGVAQILNKPVLFSGSYADLTNKPTSFTPSAHTHTIAEVTNLQASLNAKANASSLRRVETYVGPSNAQGNYTVVYATPFTSIPDIQPQIQAGNFNQFVRIVESTVNGFTVQVAQRNTVTLLSIEVLLGATVPVANLNIGVLVTERK